MSKKLSRKIRDSIAAMSAVIFLALILGFCIGPLFPTHTVYIQLVTVMIITGSAMRLVYKIVNAV